MRPKPGGLQQYLLAVSNPGKLERVGGIAGVNPNILLVLAV